MPTACKTCGGTGVIWSMRSWFTHDGYYSSRCSICDGIKVSTFRPDAQYAKFQRAARERIASDRRWASQAGANEIGKGSGIHTFGG